MRGDSIRLAVLAVALAAAGWAQSVGADDPLLRAMIDELERSRSLRIAGLEDRPYYIEYSIEDARIFNVSATLGSLMGSSLTRARVPQVAVRTGSYEFDNTNHVSSGQYSGARYDSAQWPIDDHYAAIRHNLWLATDRAYKTAVESMARKRASLRNAATPEKAPDFAKAKAVEAVMKPSNLSIDEAAWTKAALELSSVFAGYPEIFNSGADVALYLGTSYFANTEGTVLRYPESLYQVRAHAQAQAADGMTVHDVEIAVTTDGTMPPAGELKGKATAAAENVRALLKAPAGEGYSGPVLFEAGAAAQLLAQVLGENLRLVRRPVLDPGRPSPVAPSELESKLGSRILPEWISVVDDPTQTEHRGRKLSGGFPFDMEGVAPKPLTVVEKGVLKDFLRTRQPAGAASESNGRARLPGVFGARAATITNLFIEASETKPPAELKRQLMELCRERGKPYGMLVRKLDYPSSASLSELRAIMEGSRGGSRPVSPPVLVYRVYGDGREELVRGLRFRGVTVRSLRDILAASDQSEVFHYVNNGALFATIGLAGFVTPASVVSPALLFDEIEFERPQDELSKPPLVPAPPLEGKTGR